MINCNNDIRYNVIVRPRGTERQYKFQCGGKLYPIYLKYYNNDDDNNKSM